MAEEKEIGSLGVKIGLDGTGFQNGVGAINKQLAVVKSEFALATAKIGDFGKDTDSLKAKVSSLNQQIELQKQKVSALNGAFDTSAAAKGRDASATLDLEIKLNKAKAALAGMDNELKKTKMDIDKQTSGFKELSGTVLAANEKMKSSFMSIGQTIKTSLVFGGVYAALREVKQGFDAVVLGGIKFDDNIQQNSIAFTQMLGSADKAKNMLQDLTKFAASTPFEIPQVEGLAKKLLAFGFDAKSIIPNLTAMGDAAAGLGLGADGADRLAIALGQMKAKGRVQGDELLQLTEAGVPALQILADKWGVTTAEMQKMVTKGAVPADKAIQALLEGMETRFPHMMDAQSKSFSGLMSNLHDNLNQTFGEVMKPVFNWLTTEALPKAVDMTTKFTEALKAGGAVAAFKTIIPANVVDGFVSFGNAVKDIFSFIQEHGEFIKNIVIGVGSAFLAYKTITGVINGVKMAQLALNLIMEINPFVAIASAVIAIGVLIYLHWDQIKAFLTATWEVIKNLASNLGKGLSDVWESIRLNTTKIWNAIVDGVKAIIKPFVDFGIGLFNSMKGGLIKIFEGFKDYFEGYWKLVKTIFLGAILLIIDLVTGNFGKLKTDAEGIFIKLGEAFKQIWKGIKEIFSGALEAIGGYFSFAWDTIKKSAELAWNGLSAFFSSVWDGIKKAADTIWKTITTGVQTAIDWLKNLPSEMLSIGGAIIDGLVNGIKNAIGKVKDVVKDVANSVSSGIRNVLGIQSPSKVTMQLGEYTGQGLAIGLGNSISNIRKQARQLATAAIPGSTRFGGSSLDAPGNSSSGGGSTQIVNHFAEGAFQIKASDVKDIQDIVEFFKRFPQLARQFGLG